MRQYVKKLIILKGDDGKNGLIKLTKGNNTIEIECKLYENIKDGTLFGVKFNGDNILVYKLEKQIELISIYGDYNVECTEIMIVNNNLKMLLYGNTKSSRLNNSTEFINAFKEYNNINVPNNSVEVSSKNIDAKIEPVELVSNSNSYTKKENEFVEIIISNGKDVGKNIQVSSNNVEHKDECKKNETNKEIKDELINSAINNIDNKKTSKNDLNENKSKMLENINIDNNSIEFDSNNNEFDYKKKENIEIKATIEKEIKIEKNIEKKEKDISIERTVELNAGSEKKLNDSTTENIIQNTNDTENLINFNKEKINIDNNGKDSLLSEMINVNVKNGKGKKTFYERVKKQLDILLESNELNGYLMNAIENSHFVNVPFEDSKCYVLGVVMEDEKPLYIAYGVFGKKDVKPNSYYEWIPIGKIGNDGYWIAFQNAIDGEIIIP